MLETFSGLVRRVVRSLNRSGLQYMFTGALASSYDGRPRTTLDIDIVIAAQQKDLVALAKSLMKANLRVQESKLKAAWHSDYKIATLEDKKSPHTVDIIFTKRKLERNAGRISGLATYYETAESLILAKLRMLKVTIQPERAATDRQDIKVIIETTRIDLRSLRKRAKVESTAKILDDLIRRS